MLGWNLEAGKELVDADCCDPLGDRGIPDGWQPSADRLQERLRRIEKRVMFLNLGLIWLLTGDGLRFHSWQFGLFSGF